MTTGRPRNIDPGSLRHVVTLQQAVSTRSATGAEIKAWSDVDSVSASISTQGGREFYQARSVNAELTHELVIRYRPDVAATWRVKYADPKVSSPVTTRYFDIRGVVNPDERWRWLFLHCRELVGREVQS